MTGQDLLGHFDPVYIHLYLKSSLCPTNTPALSLFQVLTVLTFKNLVFSKIELLTASLIFFICLLYQH